MYLNHFNLTKQPFNITPDPALLYLSPSHKEALAAAIYGVTERKGFVAITGEVGVGKTTIIRSFLDRMDKRSLKIIHLFNPNISFKNLLELIFQELGQVSESDDVSTMVNKVHHILVNLYKTGANVVLVIDEAQNMPVETLQNLHMLSNLETATAKLLQVVFCGQPEFEEKLKGAPLRQLKQRLAIRVRILPLTRRESEAYIAYRLAKVARYNHPNIFTAGAIRRITHHAAGIPRIINTLCDNCLITAFGRRQKRVTTRIATEIITDLGEATGNSIAWRVPVLASLAVVACVLWLYGRSVSQPSSAPAIPYQESSPPVVDAKVPVPLREVQSAVKVQPAGDKPKTPRSAPVKQKIKFQKKTMRPDYKKGSIPVHKRVRKGDTLPGLVLENYGSINEYLLQLVRHNNPHIPDVDHLQGGERMYFPSWQN